MSNPITELAFMSLTLCLEMGQRLASIQELLACPQNHSDAEIVAKVREIVNAPGDLHEAMAGVTAADEKLRELAKAMKS